MRSGEGDLLVGQKDAGQMAVEVVHADDRQPPTEGERFGRGYPDQEGPTNPGPAVTATALSSGPAIPASARA